METNPSEFDFKPSGVCSKLIHFVLENGVVRDVRFAGGCDGNLQGIGKLVEGMNAVDVLERLEGISCNGRPTSCPDQLAKALRQALKTQNGFKRSDSPIVSQSGCDETRREDLTS